MTSIFRLAAIPTAILCLASAAAQTPTPTARITAATELFSLNDPFLDPWHLKLNVTLYDEQGKNPKSGTVEVWKYGADERSLAIFGESTVKRLTVENKKYRSSTGPEIPYAVTELVEHVLHPGPSLEDIQTSTPYLKKQSFGKLKTDCIMLTQPIKGVDDPPLGLFPTYCLRQDDGHLSFIADVGGESIVLRSLGKFQSHEVPMLLDIQNGDIHTATAQVASLVTYAPKPDEFDPTPDMHPTGTAHVGSGVMAASILHKVQPRYPNSTAAAGAGGSVIFRVVIGRDGHIHSLRPIAASDPDLTLAAIAAVRLWTYKPYMVNGEPTEVDSTVAVSFVVVSPF